MRHRSAHMAPGEDLEDVEGGSTTDLSRHFSYHAWEGRKGEFRWKHEV